MSGHFMIRHLAHVGGSRHRIQPKRWMLIILCFVLFGLTSPGAAQQVGPPSNSTLRPLGNRASDRTVNSDGTYGSQLPAPLAPPQSANGGLPPNTTMLSVPGGESAPLDLKAASWTFVPSPPVRTYRMHDIISIRVDEVARTRAEGNAESRKNTLYDVILRDWLKLDGLAIKPAPQSSGDPRVRGTTNQLYRADASTESRESLALNIAAEIVDVRPNGTLVIEAHKTIWVNDNAWDTSLTGVCRAQDVGPDNVILSRDILDLQIHKQERGHLRDGYRRGWFQRWLDTLNPF